MQKINIGVLIYTHDRIEDAMINMEIIRNYWPSSNLFKNIKIVHCFNGQKSWYPKKYLEDDLIRLNNSNHFQGASDLIDAGMKKIEEKYKNLDYVIVVASDTWLIKRSYLEKLIKNMASKDLYLATCPWGLPEENSLFGVGMAVDFFIVNLHWAFKYRMFPVKYKEFFDKYQDLFLYTRGGNISLEKLILARFLEAIFREYNNNVALRYLAKSKILYIKDRTPVHSGIDENGFWIRKNYWSKMGLLTHHRALPKKKIIKSAGLTKGKHINKLLTSGNLDYYLIYNDKRIDDL